MPQDTSTFLYQGHGPWHAGYKSFWRVALTRVLLACGVKFLLSICYVEDVPPYQNSRLGNQKFEHC